MRMQKRAACFGGTKSPSNRGENQSLDHSQPLLTVSGHEVHFLIRERIAIFEVRRWIAVNYPAPVESFLQPGVPEPDL